MDLPVDLMTDWLDNAPLTAEQRHVWNMTRAELIIAREKIQELEARLNTIEHPSHDEGILQTILTRPEFNREVARMLAFDERYGGLSSVLYFDIENLAEIHKKSGGDIADKVVLVMCDTLSRFVRSSDILGRLATDEFGVLLTRCDNPAAWKKGEVLAGQLQKELAKVPGCTTEPVINYGAYTFREKENVTTGLKNAAETVTRSTKDAPGS